APDEYDDLISGTCSHLPYSSYEEGKGGTQIIDTNTGESGSIGGDAAGISNRNYTITAGLQYRF
ncbi:omptin family outer membrane protease, partial [Enterobacter sp. SECR19-1250]